MRLLFPQRTAAAWGLILVLATLTYHNTFDNSFHFDDSHSIVDNPHIRSLENIPRFFVDPTAFSVMPQGAMYRPLLLVSYALNYAVSGYEILSYHVFNLLLHVVNAGLVYLLALRLLRCAVRRTPRAQRAGQLHKQPFFVAVYAVLCLGLCGISQVDGTPGELPTVAIGSGALLPRPLQ